MKNIFYSPRTILLFSVLVTLFILSAVTSSAQPFEVTNLDDAGAGSLRQAIIDANNNPGPDVITFQAGLTGTITLLTGEMAITDDLTIAGPGSNVITINADNAGRIFNIDDSDPGPTIDVSISGLSLIKGGGAQGGAIFNAETFTIIDCTFSENDAADGGGIFNSGAIENITNSTFSGNEAAFGGAIRNGGTIETITNSTFSGNSASPSSGGAIFNNNTIGNITNSTFSGNSADSVGGAIRNSGAIENITNSTFSGNSTEQEGGAIANFGTIENLMNSTFSGNSAVNVGGAIYNGPAGTINISFTTIADNEAGNEGGGIFEDALSVHIRNSILAFNTPENCEGVSMVEDEEGNYSDDDSCGFTGDNSFIELGPLANNGGPTMTMALLVGAPLRTRVRLGSVRDGPCRGEYHQSNSPHGTGYRIFLHLDRV
jgi:hypothetical protein